MMPAFWLWQGEGDGTQSHGADVEMPGCQVRAGVMECEQRRPGTGPSGHDSTCGVRQRSVPWESSWLDLFKLHTALARGHDNTATLQV